jgi:tetratricopeptide (TPR) repeat protein
MRDLRAAGATDASLVVQAAILVAKGHPIPALDVLSQGVSSAWLDRPRRLVAATASQQLGRHRDVESLLTPLVTANPDLVDAHRLLAVSFYDVGAVQEAVHHLRQTARLAPDDPRPHRLLGLMHSDYELFAEAIPCYEESLRRNPHQPDREEILLELATCLIRQLRPADALDVLSTAADGVRVDLARAECLLALGRRDEARRLVQSAVAAEPDNRAALVLEGSILLEDGDAEAAVIPLDRAVAVDPHDYLATLSLARALAQLGRDDEATATRARADEIRVLRSTFADLHREAWERPHDSEVRQRLAETAARLGREDLERVWREAAAAVAPDAPASADGTQARSGEAD